VIVASGAADETVTVDGTGSETGVAATLADGMKNNNAVDGARAAGEPRRSRRRTGGHSHVSTNTLILSPFYFVPR
jgi:hypothetical protein